MKILGVSGSPIKNSNTDRAVKTVLDATFAGQGVDADALAEKLQDEGAASFVNSWNALIDVIASKSRALK